MAKTKFFRVAVEGATVDGRVIERAHIQQMAATYNPATYTARINIEHLRGYSPEPPFNAYGSVAEVKAEEIELDIAGKKQKRLALFAAFDINDQAKSVNSNGQKLFSSVEIAPDFAGSKQAYLVGLALTDSPASLGTEVIKFSTREEQRKDNLIAISDFEFNFADENPTQDEVKGAFAAMKSFFEKLSAPAPKVEEKSPVGDAPAVTPSDLATFAQGLSQGLEALSAAIAASQSASDVRMSKLSQDLDALRGQIEGTVAPGHKSRPFSTGASGGGKIDPAQIF